MSLNPSQFQPTPYNPTPLTPSSPASFTPTEGNYKQLQPFRYWCQKVLPLVYDDSLSYYELLCKVVDYLNKTMEDVDVLHTDVDNLHIAYENLQSNMNTKYSDMVNWINSTYGDMTTWMNTSYQQLVDFCNNYFANLDVQQEINNKLDAMTASGELTTLIAAYVDPIYQAYESQINSEVNTFKSQVNTEVTRFENAVNTNIGNFEDSVGTQMNTQNSKISLLETRMDTFASLPEGSTAGNAEILDARIGKNGTTYNSLGNAIRSQFGITSGYVYGLLANNSDLDDIQDCGTYVLASGNTYDHTPTISLPAQLTVTKLLSSYVTQELYDCYYGRTWIRRLSNDTWTSWQLVAGVNSNIPIVAENADLDSVTDVAVYLLATSMNYSHLPTNVELPAILEVTSHNANSLIIQKIFAYSTGKLYTRRKSSGSWSDWNIDGENRNIPLLVQNTDMNNIIEAGVYLLATSMTYSNLPANLELPGLLEVSNYNGTSLIIQKIYDYSNGKLYTRRRSSNSWNEWNNNYDNNIGKLVKFDFATIGENYSNTAYYKEGESVTSEELASYIIPTPNVKYLARFNEPAGATIEYLDSNKEYVKRAPSFNKAFNFTGNTGGGTKTIMFFKVDRQYPYINIVYLKGTNPQVYGTDTLTPMVFANDDYSSFEIEITNKEIRGMSQSTRVSKFYEGVFNASGAIESGNFHTGIMFFKKGTVIDSELTSLSFRICGFTINTYYFTDAVKHFVVPEDMIAYIQFYPKRTNFKWTGFAPDISNADHRIFIRISTPEDIEKNPWNGKTWWCFGTSISDINPFDNTGHNGHSGKYPLYLDCVSGMRRINGAIGTGGFLSSQPDNLNVTKNVLQTPYDADLATIEILPNDNFRSASTLGDITDTTADTICGALNVCLNYLTSKTRARIAVIFVTWRFTDLDFSDDYSYVNPTAQNHVLYREAVDKLKKVCELFGVPTIDANANALEWGKRIIGVTYNDFIHPNYLGGEIFGRYIWKKLREIEPYDGDYITDTWTYVNATMQNGSIANPANTTAVNTDYVAITKDKTAYCKVNQDIIGDGAFYVYGYAVYDENKTQLRYVDYTAATTLPTARVTDDDAAYIRFMFGAKLPDLSTKTLRESMFASGDVVIGISAD